MAEASKSEILEEINKQFSKDFSSGLELKSFNWREIAMLTHSTTAITNYGFLGQFPQMREWIGERQIENLSKQAMSIKNKLFENTVAVPRTDLEDDNVSMYRNMVKQMGQTAERLPGDLIISAIKNAETDKSYDGVAFFSDKHPVFEKADGTGKKNEQKNLYVLGDEKGETELEYYVLDTTQVLKPFVYQERVKPELETKFDPAKSDKVFMEDKYIWGARARGNAGLGIWQYAAKVKTTYANLAASLKQTITGMRGLKLDGGNILYVRPSLILAPIETDFAFKQLLKAEKINNEYNVLNNVCFLETIAGL